MGDRLAMEAHEIDAGERHALLARPAAHGICMSLGHGLFGGTRHVGGLFGAKGCADRATHIVDIGNGEARSIGSDTFAVSLDQGHVDTVDRGPAHQT